MREEEAGYERVFCSFLSSILSSLIPPFPHSLSQGKRKDSGPYGEYGSWYKACKVDRWVPESTQMLLFLSLSFSRFLYSSISVSLSRSVTLISPFHSFTVSFFLCSLSLYLFLFCSLCHSLSLSLSHSLSQSLYRASVSLIMIVVVLWKCSPQTAHCESAELLRASPPFCFLISCHPHASAGIASRSCFVDTFSC